MSTFDQVFEQWGYIIREAGEAIFLESDSISELKTDRGLERYVRLSVENSVPPLDLLVILAAESLVLKLKKGLDKLDFLNFCKQLRYSLIELLIKENEKHKEALTRGNSLADFSRIAHILESENSIHEAYFRSYETETENIHSMRIYSADNTLNIVMNIGNPQMISQLGFYKCGFSYRVLEGAESYLVNSVTRTLGKNQEIGHYGLKGYNDNPDEGWVGIYCR